MLLSNDPRCERKLMCSEEDLTVIYPVLRVSTSYLKAEAETAAKIGCTGFPSVSVRGLRRTPSLPRHGPARATDVSA